MRPSLAVLPFRNLSGPEGGYFAEGMTQDLLIALAPLRDVRVVSGTSVRRFADAPPSSMAEVRDRLGVDLVVEGSVRTTAERARVTALLVDAATDEQIWAESYDRPLADLFDVQSDVALRIARALEAELSPREHRLLRSAPTRSVEAYDRYLRARVLWARRTVAHCDAAIALLEEAVELDPDFALGWVGLADAHMVRSSMAPAGIRPDLDRARACLDHALELDPYRGEPHATLGTLLVFVEGDPEGGLREYRRAVALSPGYATAHHWLGTMLVADGHVEEGLDELSLALELDPLSALVQENVALGLFYADRPADALARLEIGIELDPTYWRAWWAAGLCLASLGRLDEAGARFLRAWQVGGHGTTPDEVEAVQAAVEVAGPRAAIEALVDRRKGRPSPDRTWRVAEAVLLVILGRPDDAVRALELARQEGSLSFLIVYAPALDRLVGHPGFAPLLDDLGFVPARWR